jgi:NDP-sugar pyrophosphorylase family protein
MKQAMIFAAGLGTRLKPLTDTMPKALVPVAGKPLLWHVLTKLKHAGFERVVINVHHFADQVEQYVRENYPLFGIDIRISNERQQLLDTGGGLKNARHLFDPEWPVLIHNVDILSNADLNQLYDAALQPNTSTPHLGDNSVLLVSERTTNRHLFFANDMHLMGWKNDTTGEEKKPFPGLELTSFKPLAFSGIHIISPSLLWKMGDGHSPWGDRFSIIDFYLWAAAERNVIGQQQATLKLLDVGKQDTLHEAEQFIKQLY